MEWRFLYLLHDHVSNFIPLLQTFVTLKSSVKETLALQSFLQLITLRVAGLTTCSNFLVRKHRLSLQNVLLKGIWVDFFELCQISNSYFPPILIRKDEVS